jgi:hypothetical protein
MQPSTGSIESTDDEQAQVGPQWVDRFGRVRTPRAYYQHNNGRVVVGPGALAVFDQVFRAFRAAPSASRPTRAGGSAAGWCNASSDPSASPAAARD